MSIDSDSISLVISKKPMLKSGHQVVYPDENPYGEFLHELFCLEMRLTWLYKTILRFNKQNSLVLQQSFKTLLLEGQSEHFKSAREVKRLLVRQRFIPEFPKTPFRRAYVISLYSASALPAKPRFALIKHICKTLEYNLIDKYRTVISDLSPVADRSKLEILAEKTEDFYENLKNCHFDKN